ncbi:Actin-histidine N-methyltransferase (Protein-L-histidine N-tele-methyltransferase) (SET domain-containing protein 3 homolog), partial [Durusdinium trenchii]
AVAAAAARDAGRAAPEEAGFGGIAERDLEARHQVLEVPRDMLVDASNAMRMDPRMAGFVAQQLARGREAGCKRRRKLVSFDKDADQEAWPVILWLARRLKGVVATEPRFQAYIDVLPKVDEIHAAHLCEEGVLEEALGLEGTPLLRRVRQVRDKVAAMFAEVERAGNLDIDLASLRWAFALYWSRALVVPLTSDGTPRNTPAMVPLLDGLNHHPGSVHSLHAVRDNQALALRLGKRVGNKEAVFINYGVKGNLELVLFFGFALPTNAADFVDLELVGQRFRFFRGQEDFPRGLLDCARKVAAQKQVSQPDAVAPRLLYPAAVQVDWMDPQVYNSDSAEDASWWIEACNLGTRQTSRTLELAALQLLDETARQLEQARRRNLDQVSITAPPTLLRLVRTYLQGEVDCAAALRKRVAKLRSLLLPDRGSGMFPLLPWLVGTALACMAGGAEAGLVVHEGAQELLKRVVPVKRAFDPVVERRNVSVVVLDQARYDAAICEEVNRVFDADVVLAPEALIKDFTCSGKFGNLLSPRYLAAWCEIGEFIIVSDANVHPGLYSNARVSLDGITCSTSSSWLGSAFDLDDLKQLAVSQAKLHGSLAPDENDALAVLESPLVQVWFRGVIAAGHLWIAFLSMQGIRERLALDKLQETHRFILGINFVSMLILGILHVFGHRFITGTLPMVLVLFFVLSMTECSISCDYMLAAMYSDVLRGNQRANRKWRQRLIKAVAYVFPVFANLVFVFLSVNLNQELNDLTDAFLGFLFLTLQIWISVHLARKTHKVIRMLARGEDAMNKWQNNSGDETRTRSALLRDNLTFWIRVSVSCSAINVLLMLLIAMQQAAKSGERWVLFWSLFDIVKITNALAQVRASQIPRERKRFTFFTRESRSRRSTKVTPSTTGASASSSRFSILHKPPGKMADGAVNRNETALSS